MAVTAAALIVGAWMAWFIAGAFYGASVALWVALFELIDPVGRRWWQGSDGEAATSGQLRRCRRQGWRVVHNLMLEAGDIDHIAVGPGGVVAIETKSTDADWEWLSRQSIHRGWTRQASSSAARARALVRQHAGLAVQVRPVVAAWVRGLADVGPVECNGVRIVHGSTLADLLGDLDPVLTGEQVDQIHQALEPVARRLDVHWASRSAAAARV